MAVNRILAVDDEELNLKILLKCLQSITEIKFSIVVAADGQEAWEMLETYPDINLVLTDRMMPRMSGLELAIKMRADPRFASIPVLMLTAAGESYKISEAMDAGVTGYLTKPFTRNDLLKIVTPYLKIT